jgi:hypothetical protein
MTDIESIDGDALLRLARHVALARARGADHDFQQEVTSETIYEFLKTVGNTKAAGTNGIVVNESTAAQMAPYVSMVGRNVVAKLTTSFQQSADRWALTEYLTRRAAIEQAQGAMLTATEEDALAEDIRAGQQNRRRAVAGFHRRDSFRSSLQRVEIVTSSSRDRLPYDTETDECGTPLRSGRTVSSDFEPYSLGDILMSDLEQGRTNAKAAKHRAWDALAERAGAPMAVRGSLDARGADACTEGVRRSGGPVALATAWDRGDEVTAHRHLFRPFGELDASGKGRVVDLLLGVAEPYAVPLHRSAVLAAAV